ncbi:MAG: molybdopterin-dependent oxidoreductase [Pseudomonadota bacterium]
MVKISRRDFVRMASLMGGVSLFAGCSWFDQEKAVPKFIKGAPAVDPIETILGVDTKYTVCALCSGGCGIGCRIAQGALVKIGGNPYHPVSAAEPLEFNTPFEKAVQVGASVCAIGSSGIQSLYDPFRILKPLKRSGPRGSGKWLAITWEQAIHEIVGGGNVFGEGKVEGLKDIGSSGSGPTLLAGRTDLGSQLFLEMFVSAFPEAVLARTDDVLWNNKAVEIARSVFGEESGLLDASYETTQFLLGFGFTPLDSGQPLVSIARKLTDSRLKASCMSWMVVDPRTSTSSSKADHWVPIVPGTDARLALAIAKALFEKDASSLKHVDDELKKLADSWSMRSLVEPCGIETGIVYHIADLMAKAGERAASLFGQGILLQPQGQLTARLILSLNSMVGSVPGSGGLLCQNEALLNRLRESLIGSSLSKIQNLPLPNENRSVLLWKADPVYHSPEVAVKTFSDKKANPLIVAIDNTITETAALADYILPDTTYLERWDLCALPPSCDRLGCGFRSPVVGGFSSESEDYFPILPENLIMEDILIRLGGSLRLSEFRPDNNGKRLNSWGFYNKVFSAAVDIFDQQSTMNQMDRKAHLVKTLQRGGIFPSSNSKHSSTQPDFSGVTTSGEAISLPSLNHVSEDELLLVQYTMPFHRSPRSGINSWLLEIIPENRLVMNWSDAERRNIRQGDFVNIESPDDKVSFKIRTQLVSGIRPGVVAMAKGFGYRGSGAIASSIDGVSNRDKTRGAGLNTELMGGAFPLKVKVQKA